MACYHYTQKRRRNPVDDETELEAYQSYLLRLWQEKPATAGRPAVWRCSLEDTADRRRHGFAGLEELVVFLRARMEEAERGT